MIFGEIAIEAVRDLFWRGETHNGETVGRVAGNLFDLTADDDDLIREAPVGTDGVVIVGLVEIERAVPLRISGLGNLFVDDLENGFEIRGGGQNKETKDNWQLTHSSFGFGFFQPLEPGSSYYDATLRLQRGKTAEPLLLKLRHLDNGRHTAAGGGCRRLEDSDV